MIVPETSPHPADLALLAPQQPVAGTVQGTVPSDRQPDRQSAVSDRQPDTPFTQQPLDAEWDDALLPDRQSGTPDAYAGGTRPLPPVYVPPYQLPDLRLEWDELNADFSPGELNAERLVDLAWSCYEQLCSVASEFNPNELSPVGVQHLYLGVRAARALLRHVQQACPRGPLPPSTTLPGSYYPAFPVAKLLREAANHLHRLRSAALLMARYARNPRLKLSLQCAANSLNRTEGQLVYWVVRRLAVAAQEEPEPQGQTPETGPEIPAPSGDSLLLVEERSPEAQHAGPRAAPPEARANEPVTANLNHQFTEFSAGTAPLATPAPYPASPA
jgi:hypothetical protein